MMDASFQCMPYIARNDNVVSFFVCVNICRKNIEMVDGDICMSEGSLLQ